MGVTGGEGGELQAVVQQTDSCLSLGTRERQPAGRRDVIIQAIVVWCHRAARSSPRASPRFRPRSAQPRPVPNRDRPRPAPARFRPPDPAAPPPPPPPAKDLGEVVLAAKRKAKPVGDRPLKGILQLRNRAAQAVSAVDNAVSTAFRIVFQLPLSEREVKRRLNRLGSTSASAAGGPSSSSEFDLRDREEEERYAWEVSVDEHISKRSEQQKKLISLLVQHGAGAQRGRGRAGGALNHRPQAHNRLLARCVATQLIPWSTAAQPPARPGADKELALLLSDNQAALFDWILKLKPKDRDAITRKFEALKSKEHIDTEFVSKILVNRGQKLVRAPTPTCRAFALPRSRSARPLPAAEGATRAALTARRTRSPSRRKRRCGGTRSPRRTRTRRARRSCGGRRRWRRRRSWPRG